MAASTPGLAATLAVAAGGALGASLRYWLVTLLGLTFTTFPVGTLTVNVLGCFLAGLALPWTTGSNVAYAALIVGFCGGFTTLSAFGLDVWMLAGEGQYSRAALYLLASILLGLAAVVGGIELGRWLLRA